MAVDYYNYKKFHLADALTPANGCNVRSGYWWIVTSDDHILQFNESTWLCHSDASLAAFMQKELYPECHLEYFDHIYLPDNVK